MTVENKMFRAKRLTPTAPTTWDHPGAVSEGLYSADPVFDYRGAGFACQDENRNIYVTGLKIEESGGVNYLRQYLFKMAYTSSTDTYAQVITGGWPVLLTEEVWESPYLISRGPAALGAAYSRAGYVAAWTNEKPYLGDVISWYRLRNMASKGDGATACGDESGNGYHGTFDTGTVGEETYPKWTTDDSLACLEFTKDASTDGNNTTIGWVNTTPDGWYDAADDVSLIDACTFEVWFNTAEDHVMRGEDGHIISFSNTANGTPAIALSITTVTGNKATFHWRDDANSGVEMEVDKDHNIHISTLAAVNDGEWHHLMGVRHSASLFKLYLDGVLQATSTHTIGTTTLNASTFGAHVVGGLGYREFAGFLDEVKISKVARSAAYAAKRYAEGRKYRIDKHIAVVTLSDKSVSYVQADAYSSLQPSYTELHMGSSGNIYAGLMRYTLANGAWATTNAGGWDVRSTLYTPEGGTGFSEVHAWRRVPDSGDIIVVGKNGNIIPDSEPATPYRGPLVMRLNRDNGAKEWEWGWDSTTADPYETTLASDALSDPWEARYIAIQSTGDIFIASRNVLYKIAAGGNSPRWIRRLPTNTTCVGIEISEGTEICVQCLLREFDDPDYNYYVQLYHSVTGQPMGIWYERQTPVYTTTETPLDYGELHCDSYGYIVREIET